MKSKRTFIILGIILLVGIIAVSTILVTSGSPAARASKEYDLGNKYLLEGKYEEAIVAFEKVIAIDPRSVNARMGLSEAYIQLGEFDNAEIRLREVLDIDAEYIDAYIKLADVIIKQGDLEGVIKLLEEAYNRIGDKKLADKLEEIRPKAPTASIESGTYEQPFEVELTSLQEGWKMYYTLDGTDPDNNSIVYESPIKIEEPKTVIKLMSISETGVSSKVAEYVYVLEGSMLEQTAAPKQNSNGTIEIIDVSPKKVTEGVGTTFFVTVQYNFSNTENCIIYVGANTMEATSFELHDEYILPDTSGTYTFKFSCVPIDWNDIPFGIFVNISEYPHPSKWSPLDSAEYTLEIVNSSEGTPETTPEITPMPTDILDPITQTPTPTPAPAYFEPNRQGNAAGNIQNTGIATIQGDWIYYRNSSDGGSLYKTKTDGSSNSKVSDDSIFYINVIGDWIYYANDSDLGRIYKIKLDGSSRTKVNNDSSGYATVVDDWIYYQSGTDGNVICKIKTDGSNKTKISEDESFSFDVVGDWIYYCNWDDGYKLYRIKSDGTGRSKVSDDEGWYINIAANWIYYCGTDSRIYKIKTDGSGRSKINDDNSTQITVVGDWVYYINRDDGNKIYKVKTDGSGRKKVYDGESSYINVVGEWIYYEIYKIKTNGSQWQLVE